MWGRASDPRKMRYAPTTVPYHMMLWCLSRYWIVAQTVGLLLLHVLFLVAGCGTLLGLGRGTARMDDLCVGA